MREYHVHLNLGAETPFHLLHISDTHFTLADERDCERKRTLANNRRACFADAEQTLTKAEEYARINDAMIVHTGDLTDFVSEANLDRARRFTEENDVLFAAGNHEFSLYVGEAVEDEAYRNQSLAKVQAAFKNDIRFTARQRHGVNLIAIDDSYYQFDAEQLEALRKEIERGLPILLFMHVPLYEPAMFEDMMQREGCGFLTATPESGLSRDQSESRRNYMRANKITQETVQIIQNEPLIKAVFAGHVHHSFEGFLRPSLPQYVTGLQDLRLIEID